MIYLLLVEHYIFPEVKTNITRKASCWAFIKWHIFKDIQFIYMVF